MDSYIGRALVKELRKAEGHLVQAKCHTLIADWSRYVFEVIFIYIYIVHMFLKVFNQSCIAHTKENE